MRTEREVGAKARRRSRSLLAALALGYGALCLAASPAGATILPLGFVETLVVTGFVSPTASAHAPDGRIFVAEQDGRIRVVKNGQLLVTPFAQLPVDNVGERGLLGIALDPAFETNGYVYAYYSALDIGANRLSRLTADGDVALPGETVLAELPRHFGVEIHMGGGPHFGTDGKLYLGVGDHLNSSAPQSLGSVFGSMLRFEPDGSIPTDNPFYGVTTGLNRAIWALGLRNPFTFAFHPVSGRLFINDVGQTDWEEVNEGTPGANFGWPETEGPTDDPRFVSPIFAYSHDAPAHTSGGCAIVGGTFYAPPVPAFPESYEDGYFFGEFCRRYIRWLDPVTHEPMDFADLIEGNIADLDVGLDGSLYYLTRIGDWPRQDDGGAIYRISYTESLAPQITVHPTSQTVLVGDPVEFVADALGADSVRWQRDGVDIPGATETAYSLPSVSFADDGAGFRLVATNEFGETASRPAVLTVTDNRLPSAEIAVEMRRELYVAGDPVAFSGTASDPEDGPLSPASFTWRVDFHHDEHWHPFLPPTSGVIGGDFTIPTEGETSPNVWFRIHLSVEDSGGRTFQTFADVHPRLSQFTLQTNPPGLEVLLDGQPRTTPYEVTGVVNLTRTLGAPSPQTLDGVPYAFLRWSDGGAAEHTISSPGRSRSFTAAYARIECADGQDNDGDSLVDTADPGCRDGEGLDESPQCNDGTDNDGDTLVDLADPDCAGDSSKDRERPPGSGCGLGAELAFVLSALLGWRRRRASGVPWTRWSDRAHRL